MFSGEPLILPPLSTPHAWLEQAPVLIPQCITIGNNTAITHTLLQSRDRDIAPSSRRDPPADAGQIALAFGPPPP
jgi:hypothetical protein